MCTSLVGSDSFEIGYPCSKKGTAGRGEHDYATIVWASTWVFIAVAVTAVGTLLAGLGMPRGSVDSPAYSPAPVMGAER